MSSGRVNIITMTLAGLAKFVLGVFLAIAILIGGGAALALYFIHQVMSTPPKHVFANENGSVKQQSKPAPTPAETKVSTTQPTPTPTPSATPSPKPLEPGAYSAKVTWSEGLSMRSEPSIDAERIGGVEYNQSVVVLEESPDKKWQKIRLEDGEQEGWVKAGNIERTQEQ